MSITDLQDITRNTLKKYISIFNLSGKTVEEILAKNESELLRLFNEKSAPYPTGLSRQSMPDIHFAAQSIIAVAATLRN